MTDTAVIDAPLTSTIVKKNLAHRLPAATIAKITNMLSTGDYSLRDIATACGVSHTTVRYYAFNSGVKPPREAQIFTNQIIEANQYVLSKALDAVKRLTSRKWDAVGAASICRIIERHSDILLTQGERERIRNAPAPVYQPQPILMLIDGIFGRRLQLEPVGQVIDAEIVPEQGTAQQIQGQAIVT